MDFSRLKGESHIWDLSDLLSSFLFRFFALKRIGGTQRDRPSPWIQGSGSASEEQPVQRGKRESPGLRPRSSMKVIGREI
jgi:hypothetical protein